MDFDSFKKKRKDQFKKLVQKMDQEDNKKSYKDDRFWEPTKDKSGIGMAKIRFLPGTIEGEPFVQVWTHSFQGPTAKWYIENCLTTIGKEDPCTKFNSRLYESNIQENKDAVSKGIWSVSQKKLNPMKRRMHYIGNILVLDDPANPENNGKVFLFRFGAQIYAKIKDKTHPEFEGEQPSFVYDLWEGSDFRLKVTQKKASADNKRSYPTYETSSFDSPSELYDGDEEKLRELFEMQYDIGEFIDPDKSFKSYDELKERLDEVLGFNTETVDVSQGWKAMTSGKAKTSTSFNDVPEVKNKRNLEETLKEEEVEEETSKEDETETYNMDDEYAADDVVENVDDDEDEDDDDLEAELAKYREMAK